MGSFLLESSKNMKKLSEESTHLSEASRKKLDLLERHFDQFCEESYDGRDSGAIFDELKVLGTEERDDSVIAVFQKFVAWNYSHGVQTQTILNYLSQLRQIFAHNRIKFEVTRLRTGLKFRKIIKDELYAMQMEDIRKILPCLLEKHLSFYHSLLSTGCRPGELISVRKKDIDFTKKRPIINIRSETVKTRQGRSVFLTQEASELVLKRVSKMNDDDFVWNPNNATISTMEKYYHQMFIRACDKVGLGMKYERESSKGRQKRKITLYSFRSFFFNAVADVHREGYAHKMVGHGAYLPQYDRWNVEKKLEYFLKVEDSLTVDQTKYVNQIKNKNIDLELALKKTHDQEDRIKELELKIIELSKSKS